MALKTFTATRAADVPGRSNQLRSWHLNMSGAGTVSFCDGSAAAPLFSFTYAAATNDKYAYSQPYPVFPNGLHVEVSAGLSRGCIDIV